MSSPRKFDFSLWLESEFQISPEIVEYEFEELVQLQCVDSGIIGLHEGVCILCMLGFDLKKTLIYVKNGFVL